MIESLIKAVSEEDRGRKILRAVLGLGYTAVEVEGRNVGLSANISASAPASCTVFRKAGSLRGMQAGEVLDLGFEADLISRSLSLATFNAVSGSQGYEGDVFAKIAVRQGDRAAMVGFMAPVARMLQSRGLIVDAFDNKEINDNCIRPADQMQQALIQADIVILTATTLINGSLGDIITLPLQAREVILMGPSTPMVPGLFSATPITFLAGCRVIDGARALGIVMEGGGTEVLYCQGAMKKIIQEVR